MEQGYKVIARLEQEKYEGVKEGESEKRAMRSGYESASQQRRSVAAICEDVDLVTWWSERAKLRVVNS